MVFLLRLSVLKLIIGGIILRVFLRYISRNMLEKKGRLVLLIFSIMLSTALLIVSLGLVQVVINSYKEPIKNMQDGRDISIYSNTADPFFSLDDFSHSGLKNVEGTLYTTGIINKDDKISYANFSGRMSYDKNIVEGSFSNTDEPVCVISQRVADEFDLKIGSKFTIAINGEKNDYTVKAITANKGIFYLDNANSFKVIVPYDYLSKRVGANGKINNAYAEYDGDVDDFIDEFNEKYDNIKASSVTGEVDADGTESIEAGMYFMLIIVCFICAIIIYGVFKLIINERITVIGTFMSQGATKKKIEHILLLESLLYAVLGSIFGVIVGEIGLYFVNRLASPLAEYGIYSPFELIPAHIVAGVIFAFVLSVVSAWLPVRTIRKLQVKDVILNRIEPHHKKSNIRFIIGLIIFGIALAAYFGSGDTVNQLAPLAAVLSLIGVAMISSKIIKVIAGAVCRFFRKSTTTFLALNNVRSSKLLRSNITLLIISLAAVLSIASTGTSLTKTIEEAYTELNYDYNIENIIDSNSDKSTTDMIIEKLNSIGAVEKSSVNVQYYDVAKMKGKYIYVCGCDPKPYAYYNEYLRLNSDEYKDDYAKFVKAEDNSVVITEFLSKLLDKKVGDTIEIEIGKQKADFRVDCVIDGKLFNNSQFMLINSDKMKSIFNAREAYGITFSVNGDNKEAVEKEFKTFLSDLGATYTTRQQDTDVNIENNAIIMKLLSIFSYVAMLIASVGIFNNICICFNQRKREFAVLASVGMNGNNRRRLVLTESLASIILSVVGAIPYTIVLVDLISKLLTGMNLPITINFDWALLPKYLIVLTIIILVASLSVMKKSKKLNAVQELKYE